MKRILITLLFVNLTFLLYAQDVVYSHSIHHAFVENKGQWPEQVLFQNRIENGNVWVEQGGILFQLQDYSLMEKAHFSGKDIQEELTFQEKLVRLDFVGSQEITTIEKTGRTPHYYNYFLGNDESKWKGGVYGYEEFTLKELYPGIDFRFIEQETSLKYEFHVQPHVDPSQILLKYKGQQKLKVNKQGELIVRTALGDIIEEKPYAYQIVNGEIREVPCAFEMVGDEVRFKLGDYNKRVTLIIDPTLVFATYCGAVSDNFGMTATYGYDGTAYIAGTVYGNAYPTPDSGVYDPNSNMTVPNVGVITTDVFITKYSDDGATMLWSTFFGGGDNTQGTDAPHSLICDQNNNLYVYGTTSSTDFPITANAFQLTHGGGVPFQSVYNGLNYGVVGSDIFVAKFNENGHQLLGSTYVGGSHNDGINYTITGGNYNSASKYDSLTMNYGDQFRGEIMLDEENNILVGSSTRSSDFPTQNAFQSGFGGGQDGIIFKLKNDFSDLIFSSFFGGGKTDAIYSVKVDSSHNVVFGGGTTSMDVVVPANAYQTNHNGGAAEGFIGKLTPDGQTLSHATYLGTSNYDQVFFVEIDREDRIYALGQSYGGSFPVINAPYSNPNSSQYIARFNPELTHIEASTVFGSGSNTADISPSAFMVDICGNLYVSGWGGSVLPGATPMAGMPISPTAYQSTAPNGFDFYLMVLEREFSGLLYGTYMGGASAKEHMDGGTSRFDKSGVVYQAVCGGCGGFSDFPTSPGAWSNMNLSSNCNALTFKFDFNLIPHAEFTVDKNIGCSPFEVNFENFSSDSDTYLWDFGEGDLDSTTFEPTRVYTEPGTYIVWLTVTDSICMITDSAMQVIEVYPDIMLDVSDDIDLCEPIPINLEVDSDGTASSFIWSSNANFTDTLNATVNDSIVEIDEPTQGYYYVMAMNNGCSVVDSVFVNFTSADLSLSGEDKLCLGEETTITAVSNNPSVTFSDYTWGPDSIIVSGNGSASVTVLPSETQYLYVTATASNGCEVEDSIFIAVSSIDESLVQASVSDNNVPEGSEVTLSAEPSGYDYTWLPDDAIDQPNEQETTATVYESTTYTVLVSDGICTKSSSVWVNAFPYVCDEPFIYVPNAFTPNGDGQNDVLYLRSKIVKSAIFRVYNRWGEKVFETDNMHTGWDGTFRGKALNPDVYDYYFEGQCIDGQDFIIKGNITIIK